MKAFLYYSCNATLISHFYDVRNVKTKFDWIVINRGDLYSQVLFFKDTKKKMYLKKYTFCLKLNNKYFAWKLFS